MNKRVLTSELQTALDTGCASLLAAEHVLNFNSANRREALAERLATATDAYDEVRHLLPDAGLSIATTWHGLVLKQVRQALEAAEQNALAGGKIVSLRWDFHFPLRRKELETELEREVWSASECSEQTSDARASWKGLILDEVEHQVRRKGFDCVVEFSANVVPWRIFVALVRRRGKVVTWDELESEVCDSIERSAIRSHMTRVRNLTRPLGVGVTVVREMGYRLHAISERSTD